MSYPVWGVWVTKFSGRCREAAYTMENVMQKHKGTIFAPVPEDISSEESCGALVTFKQMEEATRKIERRYNALFRQCFDVVMEVNLHTGACRRTTFADNYPTFPMRETYEESFWDFLSYLHPDDKARVATLRSWEGLMRAHGEGVFEQICQFRFSDLKGGYRWIESRLFFMHDEGDPTFFLLWHDISAQKYSEEERLHKEQRFSLALRDIYSEIYEFDIRTDISRLVFSNNERLIPVGVGNLQNTQSIINTAIHPDDREKVLESLLGANLRRRFEQGCSEVVEEFRRIGAEGKYYWVSAVVVPLRVGDSVEDKTMLLIKDISQRKEQEQQQRLHEQYTMALRTIYDELYECNLTQNTYRAIYQVKGKYVSPPGSGVLDETVRLAAQTTIYSEDSVRFQDFFNPVNIRAGLAHGAEYLSGEFRTLQQSGGYHWTSMALFPLRNSEGDCEMCIVFVMDIDQRKRAEELARHNAFLENQRIADERYKIIVDQTNTLVFEWARENNMHYVSPELTQRFAGTYDGRDIMRVWREDQVIHPDDRDAFAAFLHDSRSQNHPEMTVRFRRRDETYIWCKVVLACQYEETGRLARYIGTLNDVHEATCSVLALHYRAEYDMLTGVFNMQTFYAQAERLLRENPERSYSIIRMDIDRFKVINDLYGLNEGDRLLQTIARLIGERMSQHSVCGRIGGDVFCMCVDYSDVELDKFVHEMTEQLAAYPLTSRLVPSFGICRVDSRETPISTLCDWAHLALKTVKGNVLIMHAFYDEKLRKHILEEKKIESQMHVALEQGEFHLYLQPKVDIATGKIVGSEGLVRWLHPEEGLIVPDRFIPLFEKNGFIIRIDEYVWEKTCALLRDWLDRGLEVSPVSVNVSRMHIHDTRLCEKLLGLLQKYRLSPDLLELELTESAFLHNDAAMIDTMERLQKYGFHFSLDDFGAGYSSLNMLKSLPVDTIKLDRAFLSEVSVSEKGKTVVRHTIALAKAMHMKVVAEGVENMEQAEFLLDAGCVVAQGFYYSPPVPVPVFEKMLLGQLFCLHNKKEAQKIIRKDELRL